jgi:hypothetical protein
MVRAHHWAITVPLVYRPAVPALYRDGAVLHRLGSLLAEPLYWDRVAAIVVVYFLALGVCAHALVYPVSTKAVRDSPHSTAFVMGMHTNP